VPPSSPVPPRSSTDDEIGEADFARLLSERAVPLFGVLEALAELGGHPITRVGYGALLHEGHELESFLDDHGARLNRRFATFTELVASLRSFAITGHSLAHAGARASSYGSDGWGESRALFLTALDESAAFVQRSVATLGRALLEEAGRVGCASAADVRPAGLYGDGRRIRLPHDIGLDRVGEDPQKVAELVSHFLQAAEMLEDLRVGEIEDVDARRRWVAENCREEQARVFEATVHNLQSTYDTHVKNTALEAGDERLRALRGHASAALHLLEAVTQLAHFHERHESDVGSARAAALLSTLVDPDEVQHVFVNRLLVAAAAVLSEGRPLAETLLSAYTHVRELFVELPAGVVLHARPVALIVGIVAHFGTPVEVEVGSKRCNAGSILEVLMALGSEPDVSSFVFRGDERPLAHIALLFDHSLGEGESGQLPAELGYLKAN
jgi:phosphotransferase system HPr-like phosphotransfer protein